MHELTRGAIRLRIEWSITGIRLTRPRATPGSGSAPLGEQSRHTTIGDSREWKWMDGEWINDDLVEFSWSWRFRFPVSSFKTNYTPVDTKAGVTSQSKRDSHISTLLLWDTDSGGLCWSTCRTYFFSGVHSEYIARLLRILFPPLFLHILSIGSAK